VLTHKYWEGVVPSCNNLADYDKEVLEKLKAFPDKIGASIEKYRFREALGEFMNLARLGNKYLADTEPWKLKNTDEKRTEAILNIAMQIAASLAVLSEPFMPFSSKKLKTILALKNVTWADAGKKIISDNHKINPAIHLFNKIEDEKIEEQLEKLQH
jgi:methionyl-tRNA synthetase